MAPMSAKPIKTAAAIINAGNLKIAPNIFNNTPITFTTITATNAFLKFISTPPL